MQSSNTTGGRIVIKAIIEKLSETISVIYLFEGKKQVATIYLNEFEITTTE